MQRSAHGPPKAPADRRKLRMRSSPGAATAGPPALTAPRVLKEVCEPIGAILDGEDHVSGRGIAHNTRQPLWRTETVGQVIGWQEGLVAA